jgi:hypothetical protein
MRHHCSPKMWEPTAAGTLSCPRCQRHYKIHRVSVMEGGHLDVWYRYAMWWETWPAVEDWVNRVKGAWRCLTTSSNGSPDPVSSMGTASHAEPVRVRVRRVADVFFVVWMLARQAFPSPRTRRRSTS